MNQRYLLHSCPCSTTSETTSLYTSTRRWTSVSFRRASRPRVRCILWNDKMSIGGRNQIGVEIELLRAAHAKRKYDYYHLLSGVDLPLKSQDYIHSFFAQNQGKEFVGITYSEFNVNDMKKKTQVYWFGMKYMRGGNWFTKKIPSALALMQRLLGIHRKYDVELAKGPNWFSITNALCEHLVTHSAEILHRFRYTCCPDEIFLQTEVVNTPFIHSIYDKDDQFRSCMRKIDWHRGSPYTWQSCDFEELINSDRLFARKFSSADMGIVERIRDYMSSLKENDKWCEKKLSTKNK